MKLLVFSMCLALSTSAFASEKICFGKGDAKGDQFEMSLRSTKVSVTSDGNNIDSGDYTRKPSDIVQGRDGVTYLDFFLGYADGSNDLLVDEDLLKDGTTGLAKVRNRGEGYSNYVYICRDKR